MKRDKVSSLELLNKELVKIDNLLIRRRGAEKELNIMKSVLNEVKEERCQNRIIIDINGIDIDELKTRVNLFKEYLMSDDIIIESSIERRCFL